MRLQIILTLLVAGLGLAACGSSNSNAGDGGSTSAQGDSANASRGIAFARCVRSHGVPNFPDPTGNGGGGLQIQRTPNSTSVNGVAVNGPAFQSAMQACRSYLPNGGHPTAAQAASMHAAALAFSRCMRAHGLPNFPDPQFSGNRVSLLFRASTRLDPNSPAFKAAQAACQPIIGKTLGTQRKAP